MAEPQTQITIDDEEPSKAKKITAIVCKCLLHGLIIAYFIWATVHFFQLNASDECKEQPAAAEEPTQAPTVAPAPAPDATAAPDAGAQANVTTPTVLCGIQFCNGYGMLLILLILLYLGLLYYFILKPKLGERVNEKCLQPTDDWWMEFSRRRLVSIIMLIILLILFFVFLFFETYQQPKKLISLIGPCFYILAGYVFSTKRSAIKWRTVIHGITCQFLLGVFCMYSEVGRRLFRCIGEKVAEFLGFTEAGSRFVFGNMIVDAFVFAFAILSVIFFFSFCISILYYLGVMQFVIFKMGWMLQQLLGTSVCESVNAAANIFLGQSESPLLIRPYIKHLTASEIHTIMVSGFATVAGTTLAAYLAFGASPAHLITSSVMAAPASLALSKLYMPETEESQTRAENIQPEPSEDSSVLDAASSGASNAIPIVLGITANIVAFVAFIAFLNAIVRCMGILVGIGGLSFELLFAKLFIPLVWAMGVPTYDCEIIAKVVATKTMINEFVAFQRLGEYSKNGEIEKRSQAIATYAICGFANPGSLGILIGALSVMAPDRRAVISSVALRAFVVGSFVCFTSASFAGLLIEEVDSTRE